MPLRNGGLATPVKRKAALLVEINGVIDPGTRTSCVGIEDTGELENDNTTIVVRIVLWEAKQPFCQFFEQLLG